MKEMVDQILSGEAVDIAGDGASYYLSVLLDGNKYKVGLTNPENIEDCFMRLNAKTMKEAGNLLIALADELENRKKFKTNDGLYYVRVDGEISCTPFYESSAFHLSLIAIGNAFKTEKDAEANKDAVLNKYQQLRDQELI